MNILLLGDIFGPSGRKAVIEKLPKLIKKKKIDFVILNGENAADPGVGITKKNFQEFLNAGADVVTTGNHVWDQKETIEFIVSEKRLLRPQNLLKGSPGNGFGIFESKNKKKVAVVNLMGNIFMKKCDDVFEEAKKFIGNVKLKKVSTPNLKSKTKKLSMGVSLGISLEAIQNSLKSLRKTCI